MGYTYSSFQTALASEMAIPNNNVLDPNFQIILPTIIDYAEQRCYRELDLLYATNAQTLLVTANSRTLDLSGLVSYVIIVQNINIITPYTQTNPDLGTRNQLTPVSQDWLDAVWNSVTGATVPRYFAMRDDVVALLGPFPDRAYTAEIIGNFRPVPLYSLGPTGQTWLSTYLPDLFLAAAMVSASGYRHNFGSQADDPKMAQSWETQTQELMASAKSEENRKKFHGWQQMTSDQTPGANP